MVAETPESERGLKPAAQGELTWREILQDLRENLIGDERGLWYTFRRAWRNPRGLAFDHVQRRDGAAVRPLRYLLLAVAIYSTVSWWLLSKAPWPRALVLSELQMRQAEFSIQHAGLLVLVILPLFALLVHLLSLRRVRLLPILVMLSYAQSQVLLAQALLVTPLALFASQALAVGPSLLLAVYLWWAVAGVLPGPRWRAWLLALLALAGAQLLNNLVVSAALRWFLD